MPVAMAEKPCAQSLSSHSLSNYLDQNKLARQLMSSATMVKVLVVDVSPLAGAVDRLNPESPRDRDQSLTSPIDVEQLSDFLSGCVGEDEELRLFCTYSSNATASNWSAFFYQDLTNQGWSGVADTCKNNRTLIKCLRELRDVFDMPTECDADEPEYELVVVLDKVTRTVADVLLTLIEDFPVDVTIYICHRFPPAIPNVLDGQAYDVELDSSMVRRFVRPELRLVEVSRLISAVTDADDVSGDESDGEMHARSAGDSHDASDDKSQGRDSATHKNVLSTREEKDRGDDDSDDQDQASASDGVSSEVSEDGSSEHDGDQTNSSEVLLHGGSDDGNDDDRGYPSDEEGSSDPDTDRSTGEQSSSSEEDDTDSDDSDPEDNDTTGDIKGAVVEENVRAFSPRFVDILAVLVAIILATDLG